MKLLWLLVCGFILILWCDAFAVEKTEDGGIEKRSLGRHRSGFNVEKRFGLRVGRLRLGGHGRLKLNVNHHDDDGQTILRRKKRFGWFKKSKKSQKTKKSKNSKRGKSMKGMIHKMKTGGHKVATGVKNVIKNIGKHLFGSHSLGKSKTRGKASLGLKLKTKGKSKKGSKGKSKKTSKTKSTKSKSNKVSKAKSKKISKGKSKKASKAKSRKNKSRSISRGTSKKASKAKSKNGSNGKSKDASKSISRKNKSRRRNSKKAKAQSKQVSRGTSKKVSKAKSNTKSKRKSKKASKAKSQKNKSRRRKRKKAAESTQIKVKKDQVVVDQVKKANEDLCQCKANGDPHFHTFDGQKIDFMGKCRYTLSRSLIADDACSFDVEVKNHVRNNKPKVSWVRSVFFKIYGIEVKLHLRNKLFVNGKRAYPPVSLAGGRLNVIKSGKSLEATTDCGIRVKFDGNHLVKVKVPKKYAGRLTGLCGDCNKEKDDFRLANGTDVTEVKERFALIGNSYLIPSQKAKPECVSVQPTLECSKKVSKLVSTDDSCGMIKNTDGPFAKCIKALGDDVIDYFDGCTYDACSYENQPAELKSSVCKSLEAFAADCEDVGIIVAWRSAGLCPLTCSENMHYSPSISGCQETCSGLPPLDQCPVDLSEGCKCDEGFVLSGETCVEEEQCGCTNTEGFYFPLGAEYISDDCSVTYTCTNTETGPQIQAVSRDADCSDHSTCSLENGEPICTCNEGYTNLPNGECVKVVPIKENIVEIPIKQEQKVIEEPELLPIFKKTEEKETPEVVGPTQEKPKSKSTKTRSMIFNPIPAMPEPQVVVEPKPEPTLEPQVLVEQKPEPEPVEQKPEEELPEPPIVVAQKSEPQPQVVIEPKEPVVAEPETQEVTVTEAPVIAEPETPAVAEPKAPVIVEPKTQEVAVPDAPVMAEPEVPLIVEPEAPVIAEQETPVIAEPEAPVVAEPEPPVAAKPETPVVAEPETPIAAEQRPEPPVVAEPDTPIDVEQKPESQVRQKPTEPERVAVEGLQTSPVPTLPVDPEEEIIQSLPVVAEPATSVIAESETPMVAEPETPLIAEPEEPVIPEPEAPVIAVPEAPVVAEPETSVVNEPETPVIAEPETPMVAEPEIPVIAEPEAPVIAEPETPVVAEPETAVVDEPETPVVGEPEAPAVAEPAPETPVVAVPEAPVVAEPETSVVNEPETPVIAEPETPMVAEPEIPVIAEPEAPVIAEPETPVVAEPETPVVAEPETPVVDEPETPVVGEPEAPAVAAPEPETPVVVEPETPVIALPEAPAGLQTSPVPLLPAEPEEKIIEVPPVVAEPAPPLIAKPETPLIAEPETPVIAEPETAVVAEPEPEVVAEPEAPVIAKPENPIAVEQKPESLLEQKPEVPEGEKISPVPQLPTEADEKIIQTPPAIVKPEPLVTAEPEPQVVTEPEPPIVAAPEQTVVAEPDVPVVVGPEVPIVAEPKPEPPVVVEPPAEPPVVTEQESPVVSKPEPTVVTEPEPTVVAEPEPPVVEQKLETKPIKFVPCECEGRGDPHYTTYDEAFLELYADCKYTMSKGELNDGNCGFDVEVKNEKHPSSGHPNRAFTQFVDVKVSGEKIRLLHGGRVLLNGVDTSLPFITPQVNVTQAGKFVKLTTRCGVQVSFDGRMIVRIKTPPSYRNRLTGLCGNCNDDRHDDIQVDGRSVNSFPTLTEGYQTLANQYVVKDDSNKPSTNPVCQVQ
ncbi:hypothetical protein SNE40_016361 [Patella caerulea]|uniref:VWFD domain-containing protein n=1 Tax=Patella caerulea TaxID=87958 RepID=A0AAN8PIT3_PATCE